MYINSEIQQKLRPSFDILDFDQKRIFLDIACSLIGENIDLSTNVLNISCSTDANIDVLVNKSLITISPVDFSLQMHELIRSMAMGVLREESSRPIRLWGLSEVYVVLGENNVTETTKVVEVLVFLLKNPDEMVHIDCEAISKIKKLRILKICHPEPEDFELSFQMSILTDFRMEYSGSLDFLSNELRLIYWHGYPFKFLPSDFYPENVVAIDLSFSNIKSFWTTRKCYKRLKVMKLRHCRNLTTTPDFTEMVNLEKLVLEGCVNLVKLHPSIGMLKKLVMLNLRDCIEIRSFPSKIEMDSLEVLILSGCLKLDNLTQVSGTLKSLVKLYADGTTITRFPSFITSLTNLQVLEIGTYQTESPTWWTSIFQKQPQSLVLPSLAGLPLLTKLKVRNCNIAEVCLKRLDFGCNNFPKLPEIMSQLLLHASRFTSLKEPPRLIHQQHNLHCYFTNCRCVYKPTSNASTNQLSFLVEYLGIQSRIREFFLRGIEMEILFKGNRIPQWFTNISKGSHVKVDLPLDWFSSKLKGYAFCVVFTLKESCIGPPGVSVNNFDGAPLVGFRATLFENIHIYDKDTMIWLWIQTCLFGWEEAEDFVTFSFGDNNEDVEVKGCGVRLVCDDNEDLKKEEETVL